MWPFSVEWVLSMVFFLSELDLFMHGYGTLHLHFLFCIFFVWSSIQPVCTRLCPQVQVDGFHALFVALLSP